MNYTVPRSWPGKTCVILAGGPSLMDQNLSLLDASNLKVITINDSWKLRPYAHVLYFCDREWWLKQTEANPSSADHSVAFRDLRYKGNWIKGGEPIGQYPEMRTVPFSGPTGFETEPTHLRHGSNSAYACINLACHFGVKKIILLGVDMQLLGGRSHWHLEKRPDNFRAILKHTMLPMFEHLVKPLEKAGVEVINASVRSALTCWKRMPLEQALETLKEKTEYGPEYNKQHRDPPLMRDSRLSEL